MRRGAGLLALAAALVLPGSAPLAAGPADEDRPPEGATAPAAPLDALLERVGEDFGGRLLKVELDTETVHGERRRVYETKLLTPDGRVIEAEYDAATLELLDFEGERKPRDRDDEDD